MTAQPSTQESTQATSTAPSETPPKASPLHPFYLIVDSCQWLERFLPLGLKLVQLRIKDLSATVLRYEISSAKTLCQAHGCQLIINDHWQLALELGCDFIHLGQEDLATAELTQIRRAGVKLGISTHDDKELAYALSLAPDYVALGPVYATQLKKMPWAPQGLEKLARWRQLVGDTPLVAIGGMTVERAAGAYEAGADAIAVVTDVLWHAQPEQRLQAWLEAAPKSAGAKP
ncbi:MAG: thiamine phosphate synthase [Gammaproteobacteria bacterium]|nr:thiamine phosphate synthase [Gammaproteobacteria bacterium]MBQ0840576.1 thiamine phosphate synthase [Gammaproteobacteria bacterium]